jgi:hypothetical protein
MLLTQIRNNVTNQLNDIKVFYEYFEDKLAITETENKNKKEVKKDDLKEVIVCNLPTENIWVYENEAYQNKAILHEQRGAFASAGVKVEKTILYKKSDKLYAFLIEMKTSMTAKQFSNCKDKIEQSLSTLSVFIAAHSDLPTFQNTELVPIGVLCYSYDEVAIYGYSDKSPTQPTFYQHFTTTKGSDMKVTVEPFSLQPYRIPIIFCQNPNQSPVTPAFEIDFQDILKRATTLP